MSVLTQPVAPLAGAGAELVGSAPPSPAGPIDSAELAQRPRPPAVRWPRPVQVLWFGQRQTSFVFHYRKQLGAVKSERTWSG
jgi:hypothetical protein